MYIHVHVQDNYETGAYIDIHIRILITYTCTCSTAKSNLCTNWGSTRRRCTSTNRLWSCIPSKCRSKHCREPEYEYCINQSFVLWLLYITYMYCKNQCIYWANTTEIFQMQSHSPCETLALHTARFRRCWWSQEPLQHSSLHELPCCSENVDNIHMYMHVYIHTAHCRMIEPVESAEIGRPDGADRNVNLLNSFKLVRIPSQVRVLPRLHVNIHVRKRLIE